MKVFQYHLLILYSSLSLITKEMHVVWSIATIWDLELVLLQKSVDLLYKTEVLDFHSKRVISMNMHLVRDRTILSCKLNIRVFYLYSPAICTKDDELFACYGVMGGFMQPQGHVQVLLNMIEFGMDPQQAIDVPRFCISIGEWSKHESKRRDIFSIISIRFGT
jgi:hypothetical protein